MKIHSVGAKSYRIPDALTDFQTKMYVHLIDWKRAHITEDHGYHNHKGEKIPFDAILPEDYVLEENMKHLYKPIWAHLSSHRDLNAFRLHQHFYHMASSQAANINLFLPILHHPNATAILAGLKGVPADFVTLDRGKLANGYCLEFWGGNFAPEKAGRGLLRDKTARAGTDSDIAIAYRNSDDDPCLWLIEHKLLEPEFTTCGGFKSKGRKSRLHCVCERSFAEILKKKKSCYYHDKCEYAYWSITERNASFFANPPADSECPFKGGLNQLWRNQLLGLAIENEGTNFKHAHFSVVHHPENKALDQSIRAYKDLILNNPKFSTLSSKAVIKSAEEYGDADLIDWVQWYRTLYLPRQ